MAATTPPSRHPLQSEPDQRLPRLEPTPNQGCDNPQNCHPERSRSQLHRDPRSRRICGLPLPALKPTHLGLALALCVSPSAHAQETPSATDTALKATADKAISFVLQREALDPAALVPQTGKPLPANGTWSIARARPASCPQADQTDQACARVLYRVPNTEVSCEWVVLLAPDGIQGTILEQNLDSTRYLLRTVTPAELKPLIVTRALPIPIRNGLGTVELRVFVSATGDPINTVVINGPKNLQATSLVAAKQWLFRPLKAGNRPIPYQFTLKFIFSPSGRVTSDP